MADSGFDIDKAHRWFAIELNNEAWDAIEGGPLDADAAERLIHAAHASCYHWMHAGDAMNHQRALGLVATAYLKVGQPEVADRHNHRAMEMAAANPEGQTDFDAACNHGCAVRIAQALGDTKRAAEQSRLCDEAKAQLEPDDAGVVEKLYPVG